MKTLTSVDDVIDALGGNVAMVSRGFAKGPQHISMWRSTQRLPAKTYVIMLEELRSFGFTAPPSLWGMLEPKNGWRNWNQSRRRRLQRAG